MKLLKIKTYPDTVLKKKAKLVTVFDKKTKQLIDDMAYTMYKANGIGLAAPQVGILKKILVYNLNPEDKNSFSSLINPIILEKKNEITSENEGCLSIPGFTANIKRFDNVLVKGTNINQKIIYIEAKGTLSIVLQHEIDHLNGTLFIERLSCLKKKIYKNRILKNFKKRK